MKKRCISLALAAAMVLSMIPAAGAAEVSSMEDGFLLPISAELPQKQSSGLMVQDEDLVLPDPHGSGFIGELPAPMPSIRSDGFLAEPSAPLKAFPESGTLMDEFAEYDESDETITPISTAEELAGMAAEGRYVLTADIDLSEAVWEPLFINGPVTLDGQGHKISGLTCALFDSTGDLTVRNLILFEPVLELDIQCGILANTVSGSLQVENCVLENFTTNVRSKWLTDMGGLVGYGEGTIDSCRVEGSVYARVSGEPSCLDIGGLIGYSSYNINASGCIITGDVSGYLIPRAGQTTKPYLFPGGMVGRGSTVTLDTCSHLGSVNHSVSSAITVETKYPQLGRGSLNLAPVPSISSPERDTEEYTIVVWAQDGLNFAPKQDVRVYANGVYAGVTDENGELVLTSKTVSSKSAVWLYINETGYFELKIPTFLADGGRTGLVLRPKIPGEIYFASALLTDTDESTHDLLSPLTNVRIPQKDTAYRQLRVDVDWNDLDEENREIMVTNAQGNKIVHLSDEQTEFIRFSVLFDANEPIYVKATGTYNGNPVEKKQLLSVSVRPIAVHLPTKEADQQVGGEKDSDKVFFLSDTGSYAPISNAVSGTVSVD